MFQAPPDGLHYTPTTAGHAWQLPARTGLGKWRLLGLLPIVACLVGPAIVWVFMKGFLAGLLPSSLPVWAPEAAAGVLAFAVLLFEWKIWRVGLAVLCGRSELRIEGDRLISVERLPLISWTWSTAASDIEGVKLVGGSADSMHNPDKNKLTKLFGITLIVKGDKRPLVLGYPIELLEPLASELVKHLERLRGKPVPFDLERGSLDELREQSQAKHKPLPLAEIAEKPEGSTATVTESGSELSIELPALGLKKGGKGMWSFAIGWNVFVFGVTAIWVVVLFGTIGSGSGGPGPTGWLIGGVVFTLFSSIGVWAGIHAWSLGHRHTVIDVIGDSVAFTTSSPFSTKESMFSAPEIDSIRVGPTGTEINNVPILELQVRYRPVQAHNSNDVAKTGLLASRPNDELRWLAGVLCHRLGLNAPTEVPREHDAFLDDPAGAA